MEITEKANQHFVPKFYFRNFSYRNNQKEIGIYNINSNFYKDRVSIKHQGSKRFFYGKDGQLEEFFCLTEQRTAPIIKNIILNNIIPAYSSNEHFELLYFFILLEERNPIHLNLLKEMLIQQHNHINNLDSSFLSEADKAKFPEFISNENLHKHIFKNSIDIVYLNMDLNYKILVNNSSVPYITSDFPIIRYNQLMENFKWDFGSYTGNGWIGMQMFIPLNEKYTIIFYDPSIYKVGNKKEKFVEISNEDVNQINMLQFLNCNQNLFFNEKGEEDYIRYIIKKASKFNHANKMITREFKNPNEPNSIIVGHTKENFKSKLNISKIKVHSGAQNFIPTDYAIQFREKAKQTYDHIQLHKNRKY